MDKFKIGDVVLTDCGEGILTSIKYDQACHDGDGKYPMQEIGLGVKEVKWIEPQRAECKCETFSYRTYTAQEHGGKILYAGHYRCGAMKALKGYSGNLLTWEGGKVIEYILVGDDGHESFIHLSNYKEKVSG